MSVFANDTVLAAEIAQAVQFKLKPKNVENQETAIIVLCPGFQAGNKLVGKFVQDGEFKAVNTEFAVFIVESETNLTAFQAFEAWKQDFLKEIHVKVLSESKQLTQGQECPLVIKTFDRLGNFETKNIEGKYSDELKSFIYEVGENITLDKTVEYSVLPGIEIQISLVY